MSELPPFRFNGFPPLPNADIDPRTSFNFYVPPPNVPAPDFPFPNAGGAFTYTNQVSIGPSSFVAPR
jgi:hypothetical protein